MGGDNSGVNAVPADLDGDGEEEIVAALLWGKHEVGDRRPEILILGQDRYLYCVDGELKLVWKSEEPVHDGLVGVEDLDGDGRREIVCAGGAWLRVLDGGGHVLAAEKFEHPPEVVLARLEGRRYIVAKAGELASAMILEEPLPAALPAGVGVAIAGGCGVLLARRRRSGRADRMVRAGEARQMLLEAMIAFGRAGASLKVLDRLRYWLINWERVAGQTSLEDTPLPRLAREFEDTVQRDLLSLASLAHRARVSSGAWRALPRQALAAASELRPVADRSGLLAADRVGRALAALDRIDACLKEIRTHLREVYRAAPVPIARQVLEDRQADLQLAGARARLVVACAAEPMVFVSSEVLEKVVDGLVDNAIRALEGREKKEVEIAVDTQGAHCRVDVRDTGDGVAEEGWERVFDRSYTTRLEGGGFGLHYAREALARYEGRIFVLAGAPGEGTTFRIVLRISEHGLAGAHAG